MKEPASYILEEWDSMCAKANKAMHSECPLLEDEVLVEMHKYLASLHVRLSAMELLLFEDSEQIYDLPELKSKIQDALD